MVDHFYFDDLPIGHVQETGARTVTEADLVLFAGLSADYHPLHTDEEYARKTPYGRRIAHGPLGVAMSIGLINREGRLDGSALALLGLEWKFTGPVFPGDTIRVRATVIERWLTSRGDKGVVVRDIAVLNQKDEMVQQGKMTLLVRRRTAGEPGDAGIAGGRMDAALRAGLRIGAAAEMRRLVTHEITAAGMGVPQPVLATPYLIATLELAAARVVQPFLPEGYTTVGARVDVTHLGPAFEGEELVATASLIGVEGRRFTFAVEAQAGGRKVSAGRHENHMIRADRFSGHRSPQ